MIKEQGRWTPQEIALLHSLKNSGMTFSDMAAEIGTTPSRVRNRLRTEALRRVPRARAHLGRRLTKAEKAQLEKRVCLKCREKFSSTWKGNRICPSCRPMGSQVVLHSVNEPIAADNRWRV